MEHYQEFLLGMRELGYTEGKNLVIDFRSADYKQERLFPLAEDLVRSKVEVIVTGVNAITREAKRATQTVPIVMITASNVVEEGFAASLARPGGNITGLVQDVGWEFGAKRVELLKEAIPHLSRVAVLDTPPSEIDKTVRESKQSILDACAGRRISVIQLPFMDDFDKSFRTALDGRAEAMMIVGRSATLYAHRKRLVETAKRYRLPASYDLGDYVEAGGLMSYFSDIFALHRRAATYVDKILKGASPAELPVEQPTKFDFMINLGTARELGIKVPPSLLMRATKVIE